MGVIHQGPAASRDRKERHNPETKPFSKDALHRDAPMQDGAESLPEAPAVLPGNIPAG